MRLPNFDISISANVQSKHEVRRDDGTPKFDFFFYTCTIFKVHVYVVLRFSCKVCFIKFCSLIGKATNVLYH